MIFGVEKAASPIQILDWMEGVDRLILCDACRGLGESGDVTTMALARRRTSDVSWSGTHDFSLTASLQLADRLDRLPPQVVIWTVEAAMGDPLDAMSSEVQCGCSTIGTFDCQRSCAFRKLERRDMHEQSLVRNLLRQVDQIRRENDAERVVEVRVEMGPLSGVEPSLLASAFDQLGCEDTVKSASLVIEQVELLAECGSCSEQFEVRGLLLPLPDLRRERESHSRR